MYNIEDRPMTKYSYSTLNETSNFTCMNSCTCKMGNERSKYDIDMFEKYQAGMNMTTENANSRCKNNNN